MTVTLTGSLSDFSLSDVLHLLAMGGRTAAVRLSGPDVTGSVCLIEGMVGAASADDSRASLLRALVSSSDVPVVDLECALAQSRPVQALVDSGAVDAESAQSVASEHCIDAIGQLLGWGSGQFEVHAGDDGPEDLGVRIAVDTCLADARDRSARWSELRASLPDAQCVLGLAPALSSPPVLDLEDWAVLARIDGRRPVSAVLAALGTAPLAAGDRLVELIRRGLVAQRSTDGEEQRAVADRLLTQFEAAASWAGSGGRPAELLVPEEVPLLVGDEPGLAEADLVWEPGAGDASAELGEGTGGFGAGVSVDVGWSEAGAPVDGAMIEVAEVAEVAEGAAFQHSGEVLGAGSAPAEPAGWAADEMLPGPAGELQGVAVSPVGPGEWAGEQQASEQQPDAQWSDEPLSEAPVQVEVDRWDAAQWAGEVQGVSTAQAESSPGAPGAVNSPEALQVPPAVAVADASLTFDQWQAPPAESGSMAPAQAGYDPQSTGAQTADWADEWSAVAPVAMSAWDGPPSALVDQVAADGDGSVDDFAVSSASLGVVAWDPEAWEGEPPVAWQGETWDAELVQAEPGGVDSGVVVPGGVDPGVDPAGSRLAEPTPVVPDVGTPWTGVEILVAACQQAAVYEPGAYEPSDGQPGAYEVSAAQPGAFEVSAVQPGAYEVSAVQPGAYEPSPGQPDVHEGADSGLTNGQDCAWQPGAHATQATEISADMHGNAQVEAPTWSPWAEALGLGIPEQRGPARGVESVGAEFAHVAQPDPAAHDLQPAGPEQAPTDPLAADPQAVDPLAAGLLAHLMSSVRGSDG